MKRRLCFITAIILVGIGVADAAIRGANTISRNTQSVVRTPTATTTRNAQTPTRQTTSTKTNTSRSAIVQRSAIRNNINARTTATPTLSRSAVVRAAVAPGTKTFDSGYNTCHDAYFTCMDQFCANQNDTYRRCVCSSKLQEIQKRENVLSDTSDSLQDFKDLNIDIIPKTSAEVKAMLTATSGEYAASNAKDTSDSAKALSGISNILAKAKSESLSTSGTLDIGGNINEIWATTDLTSGINLANLSGEQLYNAVHAQCSEFVSDKCENKSTLNMVVSAYGMYIENDCALLSATLNKKKNEANTAIRETEREMNYARLDNYNAHNSTSINDCIANVRSDITQDSACGTDYVHCMDVTGLYLNKTTGEPIYTANFYQLESQISLSGDILTNQQNRLVVAELNSKRAFAKNSLDSCRDLSDNVWDEFMRQAITEIYQAQQDRIRQVKNECLDVVNKCYDEQNASLKDFSNTNENQLIGSRLELSEEMCSEKLNTCSNLYGGGTQGMAELLSAMHTITDQKIELRCLDNLQNYVQNLCAVPTTDTLHKKYRSLECLIIDDIQLLKGKEATQEEFFNTFNALDNAHKQIIIACDRPPQEIKTLEERITSRLARGFLGDIQEPDFETRLAILKVKLHERNINIDTECMNLVAASITSDIRLLESVCNNLKLLSDIGEKITQKIVMEIIEKHGTKVKHEGINFEEILLQVSEYYGLKKEDILSKRRDAKVNEPRQIVMYLARKLTGLTFDEIGKELGGRDHSTIMNGYEKIYKAINIKDKKISIAVSTLIKKLEN